MTTKRRSIILSAMTLMLCIALVAGGTYALFTDSVKLTNHLQAGTLDITLVRTNLKTKSLNQTTGFLVETENADDVDFSKANGDNVFDMTEGTLVVPACWYDAEMQISNNSDVAFGYWIEIVFDGSVPVALAEQLQLSVTTVDGTTSKKVSESAGLIGSEAESVSILAKTGSELFNIKVEFLDLDHAVNNNAKLQNVTFDILVHAVQITEAP